MFRRLVPELSHVDFRCFFKVVFLPVEESGPWEWGSSYRGGKWEIHLRHTEVAARGTPVYFRVNLSEKLGTPMKTCTAVGHGDTNENLKTCKLRGLQWKLDNRSPQIFWQVFTEVNGSLARSSIMINFMFIPVVKLLCIFVLFFPPHFFIFDLHFLGGFLYILIQFSDLWRPPDESSLSIWIWTYCSCI